MYCYKCGKSLADDAIFCTYCGTSLKNADKKIADIFKESQSKIENPTLTINTKKKLPKVDFTWERDYTPAVVGIILGVVLGGLTFAISLAMRTDSERISFMIVRLIFEIGLRIGLVIWCVSVAKQRNRSPVGWGIFTAFFPPLALLCLGLMRRKTYSSNYSNLTMEEKSDENTSIAEKYFENDYNDEAYLFARKAIELNNNNHYAYSILSKTKLSVKDLKGAIDDIDKCIELCPECPEYYYNRGTIKKEMNDNDNDNGNEDIKKALNLGYKEN